MNKFAKKNFFLIALLMSVFVVKAEEQYQDSLEEIKQDLITAFREMSPQEFDCTEKIESFRYALCKECIGKNKNVTEEYIRREVVKILPALYAEDEDYVADIVEDIHDDMELYTDSSLAIPSKICMEIVEGRREFFNLLVAYVRTSKAKQQAAIMLDIDNLMLRSIDIHSQTSTTTTVRGVPIDKVRTVTITRGIDPHTELIFKKTVTTKYSDTGSK